MINSILHLPTQIRFPIGGERVPCHGTKLTNMPRVNKINSSGQQKFTRDHVVHLETVANLCASWSLANLFWQFVLILSRVTTAQRWDHKKKMLKQINK